MRLIFRTSMNSQKGFGSMNSEAHEQTAYEIASEGIVLLKNQSSKKKAALLPIVPENITAF